MYGRQAVFFFLKSTPPGADSSTPGVGLYLVNATYPGDLPGGLWTKKWSTHPHTLKKTHEPAMNKIYEQAFKQQQQRGECKDEAKDEGNSSS